MNKPLRSLRLCWRVMRTNTLGELESVLDQKTINVIQMAFYAGFTNGALSAERGEISGRQACEESMALSLAFAADPESTLHG